MTIRRLQPHGRLSGGAIHGDTVYLAGQVADDPTLDTEGQTADVLRRSTRCWPKPAPTSPACCFARCSLRTLPISRR